MNDRLNKTSICSIVFLDIIGYSKKPVSEQIAHKEHFNAIIREAVKDVAPNDLIILDTGDGAAIALLGSPEDAIFVSLTIRDGILELNRQQARALQVRIGVNLGPVRIVNDINGHANIIGDGINVAQRIMGFAEPNQILVSRSYYEITSRLTDELTRLFAYSGVRQDKHVREHEVYAIKPLKEAAIGEVPAPRLEEGGARPGVRLRAAGVIVISLAATAVLVGLYMTRSAPPALQAGQPAPASVALPARPQVTPVSQAGEAAPQAALVKTLAAAPAVATMPTSEAAVAGQEQREGGGGAEAAVQPAAQPASRAAAKPRKARAKPVEPAGDARQEAVRQEETKVAATKPQEAPPHAPETPQEKSAWEQFKHSVHQGASVKHCTQAEMALNQCR